jgi:NitT/TauT family transport system substrate-binding protein
VKHAKIKTREPQLLQRTENSGGRLLGGIGASLALLLIAGSGAWAQSNAPADTTKIIIGEGSSGTSQIPLYTADREGFFKKAGIDVEQQMFSGGTPSTMAAFASGAINILNLSGPELIEYDGSKVITAKAFGELVDNSYDLVAAKGINSIQDLKGKTVGISSPNAGDPIFITGVLLHYGLSPNDVTFITSGNPSNRLAALTAGAIQVTAATNAQRDISSKAGNILLKSADSPVQFPSNMLIANGDFIAAHRPLLQKFLGVLAQTTAWMKANPDAAIADCMPEMNATADACKSAIGLTFDKTVSSPYSWSSTYAVDVDGMKSALATMNILQPNTKSLTVDDVVDTSVAGTSP